MIENHSSCIKVSETHICPFCYSSKIIKTGVPKWVNNNIFVKNVIKDFYSYNACKPNINNKIIQLTKEGSLYSKGVKISVTTLLKIFKKTQKEYYMNNFLYICARCLLKNTHVGWVNIF